jgi:hypothetical protein
MWMVHACWIIDGFPLVWDEARGEFLSSPDEPTVIYQGYQLGNRRRRRRRLNERTRRPVCRQT